MQSKNQVSDRNLLMKVNQRIARSGGGGQSHVVVSVIAGAVTLKGTLAFEMQRKRLTRAASAVEGVRRVVDQMQLVVRKRA